MTCLLDELGDGMGWEGEGRLNAVLIPDVLASCLAVERSVLRLDDVLRGTVGRWAGSGGEA